MNKFKKDSWQARVMQFMGFIWTVIGIGGTLEFRSVVFFIPLMAWIVVVYLTCDEKCYEFTEEDYWRGQ